MAGAGRPASQPRPAATDLPALLDALETYDGAVVEDSPGGDVLELSWSPRGTAWFRVSVAEEVDPDRGFLRVARPDASLPLAELPAGGDRLRVRLRGPGGPGLSVPVPTGWSVSPDSLAWNGRSLSRGEARTGQGGEVLASLPAEPGVLEYTCGPRPQSLSPEETLRLLRTPPLPEPLEAELRPLELLPPEERVAGALARIRSRMAYSADPGEPVGPADAGWAARVLARGRGDCDVLNGLLALALRRLGVPARLAIGFTGEDGRLRPGLHAWTEFHVGTWQAVDASASALEQPLVTPPPRPAGVRPVPPFPRPLLRPPPGIPSPVDAGPAAAAALAPDIRPEQPVPTAPPGMAPAAPQDRSPERPWLLLAALAAALLGLGLLFVGIRRRAGFHLDGGEASGDREAVLGRMALSWSVRPDLWGTPGFSAAPILPRIRGGRVSLDAALRIARRRRLLLASPGNPLARGCRRSAALLDLSNPGFAAFLRRIPGALDLDAVQDAHPRPPVEGDGPVNALLAAANRLLDALGETRAPCLLAEGLSAEGLGDVDLGALAD
ncbi:MAG: transglutaminase domain-containing protein, partial [Deltaproteobacteria bacterium]|nr:transglutaminase domain-containing protein [Deltaproteobacteria bacterium]